ncbi:MAG: AAA family ATPase [Caldimonas sp.]
MTELPPEPPGSAGIHVRLHGAARVRQGAIVVSLERKQAAAVAWLAGHGPTPRGRLAGLLWPSASEERARGNLRQSLSKLRQSGADLMNDERGVLSLASEVTLEPPPAGAAWLDAFDYADCSELMAWLEAERESHRTLGRQAMLAEVRAAARSGALDLALIRAEALLAIDRESEEAFRALMEVFYLRGDRSAAIAVWDRCRDMLRGLYGVLPSAATQRLGQTIVDSVAAVAMPAPTEIPVTVLRPPRLVGRAGIVESLVAAWRAGDAVCVSGEGGVGKSRVLAEFAAAIGPCATVAARPGDAAVPYASLSRLVLAAVERFQPELDAVAIDGMVRLLPQTAHALGRGDAGPGPLRTPHERAEAVRALASVLRSCVDRGCAAFVFDDLQFADRASVEALQALIERGAGSLPLPSRLALGSRSEELVPHALALVASLESSRCLVHVALHPLGESEVLELMHSLDLPGFDAAVQAPRLRRRVGGNPAFLLESVKLVAALGQLGDVDQALPVPPGIEAVVERRLALLSVEARHIAGLAAVAGESFSVAMAGRALARPLAELSGPLRELEVRQVLYGRQFVHDVVAGAVRSTVPAAVAEMLHRFVAEELEHFGGEPAVIAGHWHAAGEWHRAGDQYLAAAARARHAVRPAELARQLDAAAEAYGRCGAQAARFAALRERILVSMAPDYMLTRQAQLARLQAEAAGEEQVLQALLETVSWDADHVRSKTLALAEDGLARARALALPRLVFEFAQPVAWQLAAAGEGGRALEVIDAQRDWVLSQDDLALQARFHVARSGTLAFSDRLAEAIDDTERGIAVLRAADDTLQMLPLLANLGLFRSWRGEFDVARSVLAEAAALRDRLHGSGTALIIDLHLGAALRDLGRHDEALAMLEAAVDQYRVQLVADGELLTDLVVGENHLAQLWLTLGRHDLADAAMAADDATTDLRFRTRRTTLRVRSARLAGHRDPQLVESLRTQLEALPASFARCLAGLELAKSSPPERAIAELARHDDAVVMRERPGLHLHLLGLRLDAARAVGDAAMAGACVDAMLAIDASVGPFDADPVDLWAAVHAWLVDAGDTVRAPEAAARAGRWVGNSEPGSSVPKAPAFARRRQEALRRLGIAAPKFSS